MKPLSAPIYGVEAALDELVRLRPPRAIAAFAPNGPVRTHLFGNHKSGFRGRGMEFAESRSYQPGDDIRAIDWRLTARTGRTHTKLYHEERERPVLLLVDSRVMMRFGSRDCFKSVLAARAAALLAWVAVDGGDRLGALLLGSQGLTLLPAQRAQGQLWQWLGQLAAATTSQAHITNEPSLAQALKRLNQQARPGSLLFIISDFHDLDAGAQAELRRLAQRHSVSNLLISDLLEQQAPASGYYPVSDGQQQALLDSVDARRRAAYGQAFATRQQQLQQLCHQHAMALVPLCTGDDVRQILRLPAASMTAGGR